MRRARLAAATLAVLAACGRNRAAPEEHAMPPAAMASGPVDCGHTLCGDNLFIDARPAGACAAGATCALKVTLVATGDFHVNDEYPYRFKADDAAGVTFLGTDEAGKNIFSKTAGDWTKIDPKSGAMTVKFTPVGRGNATIGGVLKLSVCSGATCQLEQSRFSTVVAVN